NFFSIVSNRFQGAGPLADWRLSWALFDTGLEIFGRSDIAVLFGTNRGYSQQVPSPGIPGTPVSHNATGKVAWNCRWEVGASYWLDWGRSRVQIMAGYEVDGYFFTDSGQLSATYSSTNPFVVTGVTTGNTRLINKGPFLNVEFKY